MPCFRSGWILRRDITKNVPSPSKKSSLNRRFTECAVPTITKHGAGAGPPSCFYSFGLEVVLLLASDESFLDTDRAFNWDQPIARFKGKGTRVHRLENKPLHLILESLILLSIEGRLRMRMSYFIERKVESSFFMKPLAVHAWSGLARWSFFLLIELGFYYMAGWRTKDDLANRGLKC